MGVTYLLDTNTVIELLDGALPTSSAELLIRAPKAVSIITQIELLGWPKTTEAYERRIRQFLSKVDLVNLNESVVEEAVAIRRRGARPKLPDAIIAATALAYGFTLVTHNLSDFQNIMGLAIQDSYA